MYILIGGNPCMLRKPKIMNTSYHADNNFNKWSNIITHSFDFVMVSPLSRHEHRVPNWNIRQMHERYGGLSNSYTPCALPRCWKEQLTFSDLPAIPWFNTVSVRCFLYVTFYRQILAVAMEGWTHVGLVRMAGERSNTWAYYCKVGICRI
jgi:hypothetical protein